MVSFNRSYRQAATKVLSSDLAEMARAGAALNNAGGRKFAPGGMESFSPGNFFRTKNPLLFSGA